MQQGLKILLLEDSTTDAELIQRLLRKAKMECDFWLAMDKKSFLHGLEVFHPDVVLSDNSLPQLDSFEALQITRRRFIHVPFILVTGTVSEEYAAGILKQGADDYILKDRMARLPAAIGAAIIQRKSLKDLADYKYALDESAIVAITDQKGIIIHANENFCRISKYSREELLGKDHRILNSGYHSASYMKNLWLTIAHGHIWRGEFRNKAKDGTLYWVDSIIIPFLNENQKPYQYLSIRYDITERKKAEQELLQTQTRFNQAQAITHMGNWELNLLTNTSRWSDEAYRIFGLEPDDHNIPPNIWLDFIHPGDREYARKVAEGSFEALKDFSLDYRIIRPNGDVRFIHTENKFEFNAEGNPVALYGIMHDVTEARHAEEELINTSLRFRYAARATADIIWELNFETGQFLIHEGEEKLPVSGVMTNWVPGTGGQSIVEKDRERINNSFRQAKTNKKCERWEEEYQINLGKTTLYIINNAIFIRDASGKAIKAIGAITDITEKKQLQDELIEQHRKEQVKLIDTALRAQEKERNLIGEELHDNVNQLLVGTKLFLSLVKSEPGKYHHLIDTCMNQLQEAIEENRKIAHTLVTPDLEQRTLSDQIVDLANSMLKPLNIAVAVNTGMFTESLLKGEQRLAVYRIAQEQCTNIVKYSGAKNVTILLSTDSSSFAMVIKDDGKGMDVNGGKTEGIGLRNIRGRLSVFNGKVAITTAPGQGFILEIMFPV